MTGKISGNLREIRKLRGMTQGELSARLTIASGESVLPITVSRWESGKRNIPAYMLGYAADVLHVSAQAFFDHRTTPDDKRLLLEYAAMHEREKDILRHIVSAWDGDTHALLHWLAMYVSIDKKRRADLVGPAIHNYNRMRSDGYVDLKSPLPDMEYLERACDALIIGRNKNSHPVEPKQQGGKGTKKEK